MNSICDVTALWDALCGGSSSTTPPRSDNNSSIYVGDTRKTQQNDESTGDSWHDSMPFRHYRLKNLVQWFPQPSPEAETRYLVSSGTADTDSDESSSNHQPLSPKISSFMQRKSSSASGSSPKSSVDYRHLHQDFVQTLLLEQVEGTQDEQPTIATVPQNSKLKDADSNTRSPLHLQMGFPGFRPSYSSDDEDDTVLDPRQNHFGKLASTRTGIVSNENNGVPVTLKKRRLLHRLHPSRHVRLASLPSPKAHSKHRRSKSSSKLLKGVDSKDESASAKDKDETHLSASRTSVLRSSLPGKSRKGSSISSSGTTSFSPTAAEAGKYKPSTYYLSQNVHLYKDRSPNSSEPYVFDPSDTINVSMVQGQSAALGKLREKTSFLNNNSTGIGDSQDDVVNDTTAPSLNQAPAFVRVSSNPTKGYNFKRTPSGNSSFIEHNVDSIKVMPGFLPNGLVETRSILKIKIGFLRMNYGILLRWNTHGKIVVIMLKKNTTDAFLKDTPPVRQVPVDPRRVFSGIGKHSFFNFTMGSCEGIPSDYNCSNRAIANASGDYGRFQSFLRMPRQLSFDLIEFHSNGSCTVVTRSTYSSSNPVTETTILTPPYFVPQPNQKTRPPPKLHVRVISAQLLHRRTSNTDISPYIKLSLGQLHHKTQVGRVGATSDNRDLVKWSATVENNASFTVSKSHKVLHVEVCDATRNRHLHGGSLGRGSIFLSEIEPSNGTTGFVEVTVKLHSAKMKPTGNKGSVILEVLYIDHNKWWANEEFQARYKAAHAEKQGSRYEYHKQGSLDSQLDAEAGYCVIC